jgi:hypothetical protein
MKFFRPRILQLLLLPAGLLTLVACRDSATYADHPYKEAHIESLPQEALIPSMLWDIMEGKISPTGQTVAVEVEHAEPKKEAKHEEGGEKKEGGHGEGGEGASGAGREAGKKFMGIKVYLYEKTPGIMRGSNFLVHFERGGGELDLANYLSDRNGSFYIAMEPDVNEPLADLRVFYVSQGRKRRVDGGIWGAGCGVFMDITSYYYKTHKDAGILTNTTRERHVTVLAGQYVFYAHKGGSLLMSQLTIKDSRFPRLYCQDETRIPEAEQENETGKDKDREHPSGE